jgi:hypothetical protein
MNFVFAKEKSAIPKYAAGSKPYVIDITKILSKIKKTSQDGMMNTSIYLMNMVLQEEFQFSLKKKKSCIYYINPSLSLDVVKNIKKALPSMDIAIKKYFLVDDGSLKKIHKHVDQVIKPR